MNITMRTKIRAIRNFLKLLGPIRCDQKPPMLENMRIPETTIVKLTVGFPKRRIYSFIKKSSRNIKPAPTDKKKKICDLKGFFLFLGTARRGRTRRKIEITSASRKTTETIISPDMRIE